MGELVESLVPDILARGDLLVVFEEMPELCEGGKVPKKLRYLVRIGRHAGIDIAYTGQRFSEIARTLTAQTDVFILFRQSEPIDLDGLARRTSRDVAEQVKNLQPQQFIVYDVRKQAEVEFTPALFSPERKKFPLIPLAKGRAYKWPQDERENATDVQQAQVGGAGNFG
jgi:hypothetical protein